MSLKSRQLKLKVLWLPNSLGLAINQTLASSPSNLVYRPLTSYYFWPKTGVWEQLKLELDSRLWLPEKEKVKTLNLVSDLINYWQKYKSIEKVENIEKNFSEVLFLELRE